ncbi:DNA primase large subunit Spp2 [Schizosaccharomyces japonicus yFS275]|uniref:DNA primase large subunit n=1 Tax=Schizosaccharomyces japonicus (strain yFS275 / FY16936) TaxID=402676 RepID=B6K0R8_SCHJY|nr:DNA primase large subunit Spp2 [Schizosaccharomyces japonicus yFS275]EEB07539.1 DNA primase large subunit Spp2 [Schizosaccharomyces japonicus yFS275]
MYRSSRTRSQNSGKKATTLSLGTAEYPTRLNFYLDPPTGEISLEEFETWALDRLYVLSEIENAIFRNKTRKEFDLLLRKVLDKHLPMSSNMARSVKGAQVDAERCKDHYSHFILRLAFCRSEELRRRFVRLESILFRFRFMQEEARERQSFVDRLHFQWELVSEEEKKLLHDKLTNACQRNIDSDTFFKVDFIRVPDLVERRSVYISRGNAYVPFSEQVSLVVDDFEQKLLMAMEKTAKILPRLDEDDRLVPILDNLGKGFIAPEYNSQSVSKKAGEFGADDIDGLVRYFPLCAQHLHHSLRRDKHLRHFGRLQYGLFLKEMGLSMEEALIFWRKSFSNISDERFSKEYRYNVRHQYGQEGNRRDYKAFSCQQILTGPQPGPGDAHGCPYRTFSVENLTQAISSLGITPDSADGREILDAVRNRHYHIACTRVLELSHPAVGTLSETINHPNQYFNLAYATHPASNTGK